MCVHLLSPINYRHLIGFFLFLSLVILTATMVPTSASTPNNPQLLITNDVSNSTFTRHNYYNGLTAVTVLRTAADDAADHAVKTTTTTTTTNASTRWPFYAYMGGAMFCLLMSSACHLLSCHSARACYVLLRLDYAGIAALIVTSFYPLVYYSFACDPLARSIYVGLITAVGAAAVVVSLTPAFERPRFRHARAALFACMGLSGLVPILHKVALYGDRPEAMAATAYEMGMGACYAVGVAVYAARVPERWMPGMFDIAGHSHQLFHVLVIAGAYFHYLAGLVYLRWRDVDGCLL